MLAIYNESNTSWVRTTISETSSKITTSRTLNDGKVRYLDILVNNDVDTSALEGAVNTDTCVTLYSGNTSVKFKNKDLKPFITTSVNYNTDVLLINIALNGRIIKSMSNDNSILGYLIAHGELFLIVSISDKTPNMRYELVLHDPKNIADTTYTFMKVNGGGYAVTSEVAQTDTVINNPTYKINRFRPARPTAVIFANNADVNALKSTLKYPDSHKIYTFVSVNDMNDDIESLKKQNYKAATLFVNADTFNGSEDKYYGVEFDTIKANFKFVNVLLSNGKVLRK